MDLLTPASSHPTRPIAAYLITHHTITNQAPIIYHQPTTKLAQHLLVSLERVNSRHRQATSIKMNTPCHPESKSNTTLTPSEKESKKRLKSELKFQRKVKTLQTRIKHSISRNDPVVEKSTREDLDALLSTKCDGNTGDQLQQQHRQVSPPIDVQGRPALDEALTIFRRLLSSIDADEKEKIHKDKIQQTKKARLLLRQMTKGTQSKSMFQDVTALRGYARQKFHERAALIIRSLGKLSPKSLEVATSSLHGDKDSLQQKEHIQQKEIMHMCWEKLGSFEKMCSLGCGPGNDAVGLTTFLRSYFNRKDGIKEILLLDYAMNEWKDAILDDLIPILVPEYANKVTCESCDVTHPLLNSSIEPSVKDSDIFLTSYLLTETRNLWDKFFVQLVGIAKVGAIFYFSEPVPWQLHRLMRMSSTETSSDASPGIDCSPLHSLRFVWIDSSMHFVDMQKLDGRSGGPAVLLAIKI